MLVTVTLKSNDDGLLRTSTGRAGPAFSVTLYVVSLNITVIANKNKWKVNSCYAILQLHVGPGRLCRHNF